MADLELTVDTSEVKGASKSLDELGKAAQRLVRIRERSANKEEAFTRKNLRLVQDRINMGKRLERQQQAEANAAENIRRKYVPLYAASKDYERAIEELNQAYAQGILTQGQYLASMENIDRQLGSFQKQGVGSKRVMNDFGMATQQVGYQVGDFLVQVQSGTNAFVAFGQQATQLVGILPLFSKTLGVSAGLLVGLSATLGIVIPLVTAVAAGFSRASGEGRTFNVILQDLSSGLDTFSGSANRLVVDLDEVRKSYGKVTREFVDLEVALQEIQMRKVFLDAFAASEALSNSMSSGFRSTVANLSSMFEELSSSMNISGGEEFILNIADALERVGNSDTLQGQLDAARNLAELVERASGGVDQMDKSQLEFYENILQTIKGLERAVLLQEGFTGEVEKTKSEAKILGEIFSGFEIDNILTQFDSLNEKLGTAIFGAGTFMGRMGRIFGAVGDAAKKMRAGQALEMDNLAAQYGLYGQGRQAFDEANREARYDIPGAGDSQGGGGAAQESALARLQKQVDLERRLLEVSDAKARVIRALGDDYDKYNATMGDSIQTLIENIEKTEELKNKQAEIQGIADTIQSSMSDAFMSMVDGTKSASDAFKDMARAIIKELYDVLVVQRLVGSFDAKSGEGTGLLGMIMGGIFGKATGGTMNPGMPYLVGEKGPEIVMPGTRSTVMNDNLSAKAMGGGGQLVDVRVFVDDNGNFDAKVDRISRQNISRAAPAIVQQSVGEVVNKVKRGGSTKDAFR